MDLFVGEHREREVRVNWLFYDCVAARAAVFLSVARRRSFLVGGGLAEGVRGRRLEVLLLLFAASL